MADCRICVQDCSIHEDVWKALKENCRNYKPKPMTNADRIRAMSDEELAELFANWIQDCGCNNVPCREPCAKKLDADIFAAAPCEKNWLDWLRQEATNDP